MKQIIRVAAMLGALLVLSYPAYAEDNPHLEAARQALDQLDYPAAASSLEEALRWGNNTPASMADIYQLLGKVYAALDKPLKAETYFRELLAISPEATLPAGSSPKLKRPFQTAKEYMKQYEPLAASCKADPQTLSVVIQVSSDPLNMIAGAKALYRDASSAVTTAEAQGRQAITVKIPVRARVEVVCVAIDKFGNHLIEVGSFAEPIVITPSAEQLAEQGVGAEGGDGSGAADQEPKDNGSPRGKPGFFARWTTWGAVALVFGGAGTYFAIEAGNDQDELDQIIRQSTDYDYTRAKEVEDRGKRNALIANVSLGVAGACTVAAVVFLLRGNGSSDEEAEDESSVTIAPTPLPGGGAVTFHIPF